MSVSRLGLTGDDNKFFGGIVTQKENRGKLWLFKRICADPSRFYIFPL